MFRIRLVAEMGLRFDRYFDFIGGEDHDFFIRARAQGATAAWLVEALVFEPVIPERATRRYQIYRHFFQGISTVLIYRRHHSLLSTWLYFPMKATGKCIGALSHLLMALFVSPAMNFNKSMYRLARAFGLLCGLANIVVEPYRHE